MALANFEYGDPAHVAYLQQRQQIKRTRGCVACMRRDHSIGVVLGRAVCGAGHQPHAGGWCNNWQHDEDIGYATADQHTTG